MMETSRGPHRDIINNLLKWDGIKWPEQAADQLDIYLEELYQWNAVVNLTGIRSMQEMALKHIGDTIILAKWLPPGKKSVLDIGTGAGVPGLILKILRPDLNMVLVDAVRKKVSFLKSTIARLDLTGIEAEHLRLGNRQADARVSHWRRFDCIVSQAIGGIDYLARLARPLMARGAIVVAMKGPKGIEELKRSAKALSELGFRARPVEMLQPLTGLKRILVVMEKE